MNITNDAAHIVPPGERIKNNHGDTKMYIQRSAEVLELTGLPKTGLFPKMLRPRKTENCLQVKHGRHMTANLKV